MLRTEEEHSMAPGTQERVIQLIKEIVLKRQEAWALHESLQRTEDETKVKKTKYMLPPDILEEDIDWEEIQYQVPERCIPVRADVREFDWKALGDTVKFDAIVMDPPWQLAGANPTRGVAISYNSLTDQNILDMNIPAVAKDDSMLFIWTINAKYNLALQMIEKWGYTLVDDIAWVKRTVNRRMAKGHGFFLQHAKENCLIGVKGTPRIDSNAKLPDVLFSERRGQSQKPDELYAMIEQLMPNAEYIEVFGRKNCLRNDWVTIGNEL